VVLDTNVLLRGLISDTSAASRILAAAEQRRFVTLLSRPVVSEYRAVLTDEEIVARFPSLSQKRVMLTLLRLRYCGDYLRQTGVRFEFPRDERDSKFIELAIAGRASHMVSSDSDLLSLPGGRTDACRRFRQRLPGVHVLQPDEFIARFGPELGITD
jgi:putative PIN family toxin of toxin-antitoxin system